MRFKGHDLDKMPPSKPCSPRVISFPPPEWPCDPKAVTGVILLSLPQGVATKQKDYSFLPGMSHTLLSGPDSIRLERPRATTAFPVPSWPIKINFEENKQKEASTQKSKCNSGSQQEGLKGGGQTVGGRAAVGPRAPRNRPLPTPGTGNPQTKTLSLFPSRLKSA